MFFERMEAGNPLSVLLRAARERGFAATIVAAGRIAEAVADLERARDSGAMDATIWQERLVAVREPLPEEFPVRSVILLAVPSSEVRVSFQRGRSIELTMPPTYVEYATLPTAIAAWAGALLESHGHHVKPAGRIPLKTLAVRSGLGEYGRNNVCYVPAMGSWAHLVGLYSDLEPSGESWRAPKMLDRCIACRACVKACPTGAILTEQFLLRAERCITFHTERAGDIPLPDWGTQRPASVFGCTRCQTKCPENRPVPLPVEGGPAFDAIETEQLLTGVPLDALSEHTTAKLRHLDWIDAYDRLSRNLEGLLR